jgi:hypothetical protein
MKVTKLEPFPPGANPYTQDAYNMGTSIGNNVEVMYDKHPSQHASYLIVVNKETGERLRIEVDSVDEKMTEQKAAAQSEKPLKNWEGEVIEDLDAQLPRFVVQADKPKSEKPLEIIMGEKPPEPFRK